MRRADRTLYIVPATATKSKSIYLIGGTDEFSIKETAAKLARELASEGAGEFGVDIVESDATNQDAAIKVISRVVEALNTVGLFGGEKLVWWKNTELLGDTPVTRTESVKEALAELGDQLKRGLPDGVTLLISAIGCDKRRTLYKTLEKLSEIQIFDALEEGKGQSEEEVVEVIQTRLRGERKTMTPAALEAFRGLVAADLREIANELTKVSLYVGKRAEIADLDVRAVCSASRQAVIWELTDALGTRNLPRAIAALENLLGSGEQPIGVVMMLAAQFRLMLLAKDLMTRKLITVSDPPGGGFPFVKSFERLSEEDTAHFPRTKDGALPNAWRLYRCALAVRNFSSVELERAMELLLEANLQLVSTQLDERLVLEEALVKIAGGRATLSR